MECVLIDPREAISSAADILRESWRAPGLYYSDEYLEWEFNSPGSDVFGVFAYDGSIPVGFIAAVPRRMRYNRQPVDVYVVSWLAVRPAWRGRSVSTQLYGTLLRNLFVKSAPVIIFARAGSMASELVVKNFAAAGFSHRLLGEFKTYGFVPRPSDRQEDVSVVESTGEQLTEVIERCVGMPILWSSPDPRQWLHYQCDPRGRKFLVGRRSDGQLESAAMIVRTESLSVRGPEKIATLDCVWMPHPDAKHLSALARYAADIWSGDCHSRVVTASSTAGIDAATVRQAGFRETASGFVGHLFCVDHQSELLESTSTNLEII